MVLKGVGFKIHRTISQKTLRASKEVWILSYEI